MNAPTMTDLMVPPETLDDYLAANPPHEVVLVNDKHRPFLYVVERETDQRVYGKSSGHYYSPSFVAKAAVIKRHATEADLQKVRSAIGERDRRIRDANAWYAKRLDEIAGVVP